MNDRENVLNSNYDNWDFECSRCKLFTKDKSKCNLQNLFLDLVSGNVIDEKLNPNTGAVERTAHINPPLFLCDLNDEELMLLFFPELKNRKIMKYEMKGKKKERPLGLYNICDSAQYSQYKTHFLKRDDDNNRFFTVYYWETREDGDSGEMYPIEEIVENMEKRCAYFFNKYSHQTTDLNFFLSTHIKEYIDHIENLNTSPHKEGQLSIEQKKNTLLEFFKTIKDNNKILLSRLLIITSFRIKSITPSIFYNIIMGSNTHLNELADESDKQYSQALYSMDLGEKQIYLKQAYSKITKKTKFAKQIMLAYGKSVFSTGNYIEAFAAFKKLTMEFSDFCEGYRYLAHCYENGVGCDKSDELAFENYLRAAELEDSESLVWLSNKILESNTADKYKVIVYCQIVLKNEAISKSSWYGKAAFILANLSDDKDEAIRYYKLSAESGYAPAISKLRALEKKKRVIDENENAINNVETKEKFIITNCVAISKSVFKDIDFNDYYVYSTKEQSKLHYKSIPEFLNEKYDDDVDAGKIPESVFAFCSEDETQNINDALLLLDYLYNKSIDLGLNFDENTAKQKKDALIKAIDIFVSASYDTATTLIDASLADMGDVYFKVHVFDRDKSTARWLLTAHPLFVPVLSEKERKKVHMIALGKTPFIYNLIKESVACCYMSTCDLKLTVVDNEVSFIENKFKQEASGLATAPLKKKLTPDFLKIDLSSIALENAIAGKDESDNLFKGNYFVVDVGSDFENIRLAKRLRTYLLRYDDTFKNFPFIAVRVSDPRNAYLAERLTVGNKAPNNSNWFNNYGLCVFSDCCPAFTEMSLIEKLGLNMHLSYYGNDIAAGKQSYFTYSYNVDSSESAAVGLIYKMFDCDVTFDKQSDYSTMTFDTLKDLAERYSEKIKNPELLNKAASTEQTRFNCYLLANGWHYARPEQVLAYMAESKSSSHKQELAKLHPFMFDFEDFLEKGHSYSKFIILKNHLGDSKLRNPKESTIGSVKNVLEYFRENDTDKGIMNAKEER